MSLSEASHLETGLGDFDGDGITDLAVWSPSTGTWWVCDHSLYKPPYKQEDKEKCQQPKVTLGQQDDVPVPGKYDMSGKGVGNTDLAVWHPRTGIWEICYNSEYNDVDNACFNPPQQLQWLGDASFIPV